MARDRLLVIEAHSDDSAISASGYLDKFRDRFDYHFLCATISDIRLHHFGLVTRKQRIDEYDSYVRAFGGEWHRSDGLPFDADARLDQTPKAEIVAAIENVIAAVEPKTIILQGPSFHHDHTIVYEAAIAATRPTARFCPDEILIMENPTYVHSVGPSTDFSPTTYCAMTEEELRRKLDLFKRCFPTQIREDKNYLSVEGITAWARYRGIECRRLYAEAFRTYMRVV